MFRLFEDFKEGWEVVIEHQIIRVAHTGERYEEHARLAHSRREFYDHLIERHTLRFPWSQRPT